MEGPERENGRPSLPLDTAPTFSFLASKAKPDQKISLITYAMTKSVENGIRAIIKVIGTFPNEDAAEERMKKEMGKGTMKVAKIVPTGNWVIIQEPNAVPSEALDRVNSRGMVKRAIANTNREAEERDKQEKAEYERYVEEQRSHEKALEDPDSIERYVMDLKRLENIPGHISAYRSQIDTINSEILRLETLCPGLEKKISEVRERHPEYDSRVKETIARMTT
jgi:hypothetical protein